LKIKSQSVILDNLDWQILHLLQRNAKLTFAEIGKKFNVAHSTVYDRIQRMEEHGVIKKYEAVVDPEKIGLNHTIAMMNIVTDPKETENIAEKLTRFNEVLEVLTAFSEEIIVAAKVATKNQAELQSFIAKSIAPLPGVLRIRTSIITKKYKEERFPAIS
jgi:Lrp/AsnC family transcriptional regulator, regulator for asnA, asnC and gidA